MNRKIAVQGRGVKEKIPQIRCETPVRRSQAIPKQWVVKRSEAGICVSSAQSGNRRLAATFFESAAGVLFNVAQSPLQPSTSSCTGGAPVTIGFNRTKGRLVLGPDTVVVNGADYSAGLNVPTPPTGFRYLCTRCHHAAGLANDPFW